MPAARTPRSVSTRRWRGRCTLGGGGGSSRSLTLTPTLTLTKPNPHQVYLRRRWGKQQIEERCAATMTSNEVIGLGVGLGVGVGLGLGLGLGLG